MIKIQVALLLLHTNCLLWNNNYAVNAKPMSRTLKSEKVKRPKLDKYASYTESSIPISTSPPNDYKESNIFDAGYDDTAPPTVSPTYFVRVEKDVIPVPVVDVVSQISESVASVINESHISMSESPTLSPTAVSNDKKLPILTTVKNKVSEILTKPETSTYLPTEPSKKDVTFEPTTAPTTISIKKNDISTKETKEEKGKNISAAVTASTTKSDDNIGLGMTFGIIIIVILSIFIFVSAHRVIKNRKYYSDKLNVNDSYSTLGLDTDCDINNLSFDNSIVKNVDKNQENNIMQFKVPKDNNTITTTESILTDLTTLDNNKQQIKKISSSLSKEDELFISSVYNRYCNDKNIEEGNFKIRDVEDNQSVVTRASSQYVAEIDNSDSINKHYLYLTRNRSRYSSGANAFDNQDDVSSKLPDTYLL